VTDIDRDLWPKLSPLLDELLELPEDACARRLAELRREDPTVADALATLLGRLPELEAGAFLETPAVARTAGLAGQQVGAYTLERELGAGGMGSVWLARRSDGRYQGQVAIKFLRAGFFGHGDAARFEREGSILARLSHPHIARLLDAGLAAGGTQPFLVLEFIDGQPIDQYCAAHGLPTSARVALFLDVLAAVAHAHNRLILHRDLKPSNIFVTKTGDVKLLDFGIAKLLHDPEGGTAATDLTQRAGPAFTPQFAAPEQLQGGEVTTATDVYALGVLLYMLLGGPHPTAGPTDTTMDRMRAIVELEPRRLSEAVLRAGRQGRTGQVDPAARKLARELRGDLDTIVARALKKAPADRYANATDLGDDLRRWLDHKPIAARRDSRLYRMAKFVRRHRTGVAAGTLTAIAVGVGVGVALWEGREAQAQRVQAEGLIEFMLGDLRKKLQPVGRLDALDAVGDKALAYYAAQDPSRLDADSLGRRARALHLIGDLAEQRGKLDEAERDFQQAAETTAALLARNPTDGQRLFDHSQSEYWLGYVQWRRGRLKEADAAMRRYYALAVQMTAADPANVDWRIEKAYAAQNVGVVQIDLGRYEAALASSREAHALLSPIAKTRPDVVVDDANMVGWIAAAQESLGRYDEAIASEREKIALVAGAPGGATNRDAQYLVANAHHEIARQLLALGRLEEAEANAREALAAHAALATVDASNLDWLFESLAARLHLEEILLARGDADGARALHAQDAEPLARLLARPSPKRNWRISEAGISARLDGRLATTLEERTKAIAGLEAYRADVARFQHDGSELTAGERVNVAGALLELGDLYDAQARPADARASWEESARSLGQRQAAESPPTLALRAQAALRLGAIDEARALADTLGATPYRHPAYAEIRQRLAHAQGAPAH
jgi:serine/threonine-protein kinase